MSTDQDISVGSPDSGVEDVLVNSVANLLLNNQQSSNEESEEQESSESFESTTKPVNDQRVAIVPMHPHKLQKMSSISSEDTLASTADEKEPPFSPRTKEQRLDLLKELLETYFSDNYLTRDIFLLKHFRKSKEGWISLKFMASYKKIKRTAKNREELEEAVRMSPQLELNSEGNKIRRKAALPSCIDEYIPTRMTLIGSLPKDMRNLTSLSNFLAEYGEVASLQVLRPGVNVPDILMDTVANFPDMREQWCALVEFDEIQSAGKLSSDINEGKTNADIAWALELVMPWKNRKNSDRLEKPMWTETIRNRGRSPSSGYSSPCLTPEQSPHGCHAGKHPNNRGLSKRERIVLGRSCQPTCCQHSHFNHNCSPKAVYCGRFSARQTGGDNGYRSPKRPSSQMTADTCDNWRSSPKTQ